jgi:hypothetical protein
MKHLLFFIMSAIVSYGSLAQQKQSGSIEKYLSKLPNLNLTLPKFSPTVPLTQNHFSKFTVIDYRPDASRSGICMQNLQEAQVTFDNTPVKKVVSDFLNKNYSTIDYSNELIIVLKKLWYSSIEPEGAYSGAGHEAEVNNGVSRARLQFAVESYLRTEAGFVPFAAFDTVMLNSYQLEVCGSSMLSDALSAFAQRVNHKAIEKILASRRPFDKIEVDSMSRRDLKRQIYMNDSLKKGIYMTRENFFNNEPSDVAFEVQKDKAGLSSLYIKNETGQLRYTRNVWGYCDGQRSYIMLDGNLFPIYQNGYAFYVFGSKRYQERRETGARDMMFPSVPVQPQVFTSPLGAAAVGLMGDAMGKTRREVRLFILDNTTGEVL